MADFHSPLTIILDNGSSSIKVGSTQKEVPIYTMPSVVGYPSTPVSPPSPSIRDRNSHDENEENILQTSKLEGRNFFEREADRVKSGADGSKWYAAEEAIEKRSHLFLRYPVEHGIVVDWNAMEHLWTHALHKMNVPQSICSNPITCSSSTPTPAPTVSSSFSPSSSPSPPHHTRVMLTEAMLGPTLQRQRATEIMIEKLNISAVFIGLQSVLSLFASGRTTGLVIDSGYGVTHVVPVYEGYPLPHAIQTMHVGGKHLTNFMLYLLQKNPGFDCQDKKDMREQLEIAEDVKKKLCYVALDYEKECISQLQQEKLRLEACYSLPAPRLRLSTEKFTCPEAMFRPSLLKAMEGDANKVDYCEANNHCDKENGLPSKVARAIRNCEVEIRVELLSNIVLAGGNTCFTGLKERLRMDLAALGAKALGVQSEEEVEKLKVIAMSNGSQLAWTGGCILAQQLPAERWVTKEVYDEVGQSVMNKYAQLS